MAELTYGSVCSGIEAATVAWHDLGLKPSWFSEIEPFPSALLAHLYPDVPNLGDMTAIPSAIPFGLCDAPDVLVGGTPCQAFSVAGLRNGLSDHRGQLTLSFVELANAIDEQRKNDGEEPCVVLWENVPGVLSSKDNAFGCFLAGLAGETVPLEPPGRKWGYAGVVLGPQRAVAWRTLDAQYFGLAQRRRRVFVAASARDRFDPAEVLFEFDGLRRDTPPSREARKETSEGIGRGTENANFNVASFKYTMGSKAHGIGYAEQQSPTLDTKPDSIAAIYTLARGQGGAEVGVDRCPTLTCNHEQPIAAYVVHGTQDPCVSDTTAFALGRNNGGENAVCFQQNTRDEVRLIGGDGKIAGALAAESGAKQTNCICNTVSWSEEVYSTLLRGGSGGRHDGVAYSVKTAHTKSNGWGVQEEEVTHTLSTDSGPAVCEPYTLAVRGRGEHSNLEYRQDGSANALLTPNGGRSGIGVGAVCTPEYHIRRLTPKECERLQGFPDSYTGVPFKGKPASDSNRYKALGNSMAVPVMRWIGTRIVHHLHK